MCSKELSIEGLWKEEEKQVLKYMKPRAGVWEIIALISRITL